MQSSLPNHAGCDLALSIEADVSWISNCSVGGRMENYCQTFHRSIAVIRRLQLSTTDLFLFFWAA
jgi:hypothetical protein